MKKKSLRELLQDFALNVQLDWDANASEKVCQKKIDKYCSEIQTLKQEIDWEFIHHTILIVTRSFVKANEAIEILKQEGIFKQKRRK